MTDQSDIGFEKRVVVICTSLVKEVLDNAEPTPQRSVDLLTTLEKDSTVQTSGNCKMTLAILDKTKIGKTLTKSIKAFKRHKRTAPDDETAVWENAISVAEKLLTSYKDAADLEAKKMAQKKKASDTKQSAMPGLPSSATVYKTRLVSQKKEMYKDPPALPPAHIDVEEEDVGEPKRNKSTGELTFKAGSDEEDDANLKKLLKDFHPNRTPEEILRAGSFGGTYFREIVSAVTNVKYNPTDVLKSTVKPEWISGLDKGTMLISQTYRPSLNKFKVKCGGSLGMWESSGWISDSDPYGWFQWYCRFYQGRRCSDDARQISRQLKSAGPKGRFRSQLCNKCIAANTHAEDVKISPVIRQTLLHWGLELNAELLERHRNR